MNPDDFPNLNSPNGVPMFGGGTRWPGTDHDEYWSLYTPGSIESNWEPNTEYDSDFNTDSYGLSDMKSSPARASASATKERKKRTKYRDQKLSPPENNEEFSQRGRTTAPKRPFF